MKALDPYWIWIRIVIQTKMLDPDPDEMNADPQPWIIYTVEENPRDHKRVKIPAGCSKQQLYKLFE
jgi:hypothetical protein